MELDVDAEIRKIWDEIGLTEEERSSEVIPLKEKIDKVKRDFIDETVQKCQTLAIEIEDIKAQHKHMLQISGAALQEIENVEKNGLHGTLKERFDQVTDAFDEYMPHFTERVDIFKKKIKILDEMFDDLEIPETDREDYTAVGNEDLTDQRIQRFQTKIDSLQVQINANNKYAEDLSQKIVELSNILGLEVDERVEMIMSSHPVRPSQLLMLKEEVEDLEDKANENRERIADLAVTIKNLWNILKVDEAEQEEFLNSHDGISFDVIRSCVDLINDLNARRNKQIPTLIKEVKQDIKKLCATMRYTHEQQDEVFHRAIDRMNALNQMDANLSSTLLKTPVKPRQQEETTQEEQEKPKEENTEEKKAEEVQQETKPEENKQQEVKPEETKEELNEQQEAKPEEVQQQEKLEQQKEEKQEEPKENEQQEDTKKEEMENKETTENTEEKKEEEKEENKAEKETEEKEPKNEEKPAETEQQQTEKVEEEQPEEQEKKEEKVSEEEEENEPKKVFVDSDDLELETDVEIGKTKWEREAESYVPKPNTPTENAAIALFESLDAEMHRLRKLRQQSLPILELIKQRESIISEMNALKESQPADLGATRKVIRGKKPSTSSNTEIIAKTARPSTSAKETKEKKSSLNAAETLKRSSIDKAEENAPKEKRVSINTTEIVDTKTQKPKKVSLDTTSTRKKERPLSATTKSRSLIPHQESPEVIRLAPPNPTDLLHAEKVTRRAKIMLPKIEKKLVVALSEFKKENGEDFTIDGVVYADNLKTVTLTEADKRIARTSLSSTNSSILSSRTTKSKTVKSAKRNSH